MNTATTHSPMAYNSRTGFFARAEAWLDELSRWGISLSNGPIRWYRLALLIALAAAARMPWSI